MGAINSTLLSSPTLLSNTTLINATLIGNITLIGNTTLVGNTSLLSNTTLPSTEPTFDILPPDFDPLTQVFDIVDSFGNDVEIGMDALASFVKNGIIQSILQASQIGAALAVLLLLLILTKPEKRRLPVFALNVLALLFTVIAQILACLYYTSSWYTPYARFTADYSFVSQSATDVVIAAPVFLVLVVLALEASLVLQVHVVCVTLSRLQRALMLSLSIIVAALAVAFRIAQAADNILANAVRKQSGDARQWLVQARDVTLAVSICFFSAVFCVRLGWSLLQRRRMGLRQFGPMQVILIGGAQTMIIPAILAIAQFIAPTTRVNSFILTITVLSLPLTSLWASAAASYTPSSTAGGNNNGNGLAGGGLKPSGGDDHARLIHSGTFIASPTSTGGFGNKGKGFFSGLSSFGSGIHRTGGGRGADDAGSKASQIVVVRDVDVLAEKAADVEMGPVVR